MQGNLTEATSIYLQIAQMLEDNILRNILLEEEQAPSTNELARLYSINPATAAKGINLLVDKGILYKKRGVGMFVAGGSRQKIIAERKQDFYQRYVRSLVTEAQSLNITSNELASMIANAMKDGK